MKRKKLAQYQKAQNRALSYKEVYDLYHGQSLSWREVMTECGDPKENAVAECVKGIVKNELLMGMSFFSINEVKEALKVAIDFYNNERPHMSLDWKTPAQAALCTGELKKKWKSHREIALKGLVA